MAATVRYRDTLPTEATFSEKLTYASLEPFLPMYVLFKAIKELGFQKIARNVLLRFQTVHLVRTCYFITNSQ
jgi:hypothetical protein